MHVHVQCLADTTAMNCSAEMCSHLCVTAYNNFEARSHTGADASTCSLYSQ